MSSPVSCFTSLDLKIHRQAITATDPKTCCLLLMRLQQGLRPRQVPCRQHVSWLLRGWKYTRGNQVLDSSARAGFICGHSIIWAWQGNAWEDASKAHSCEFQPNPANQTCRGLGPRDVRTGDNDGNGLIHQLAVLEKRQGESARLRAKSTILQQIRPRPPTQTFSWDNRYFFQTRCHPESDSLGSHSKVRTNSQMLGRKRKL